MSFKKVVLFCCCFIVVTGFVWGADQNYFGKIVKGVKIEGLKNLTKSDLKITSFFTKNGQRLQEVKVIKDINNLFLTGYFVKVEKYFSPLGSGVLVTYKVTEQPLIKNIFIKGNTVYKDKNLKKLLKNKEGFVFNAKFIDFDKRSIEKKYLDNGYKLFQIVKISFENDQILKLEMAEGEIEEIRFNGLQKIKKFVLTRGIASQKGAVFNVNNIQKDRIVLSGLGYFSEVSSPKLMLGKDETKIVMVFELKERKFNNLAIGIESSDNELMGFLDLTFNNLWFGGDILAGKVQTNLLDLNFDIEEYSLRYNQPWLLDLVPIDFTLAGWIEYEKDYLNGVLENSQRNGGNMIFKIPLVSDALFFTAKLKKENVYPEDKTTYTDYALNSIAIALNYSDINNWYNPKSGLYWTVQHERAGNFGYFDLGGVDLTRTIFNGAVFLPLMPQDTLAFHFSAGLLNIAENINLFEFEKFRLGGAGSIRGYGIPDSGPKKILFNVEYRHDFNSFIQGVFFIDIGKTFSDELDFNINTFKAGRGLGIRFFTPIGPVRFDWGISNEQTFLYFNLGQVF
ncbi:BamA/TamA family outer membrane protein [bacterium]|nr:BamA/TamA family outer membrane protein [bacterium]MBT7088669.1 BamA/TamA family outer membrane protein [bacterium]